MQPRRGLPPAPPTLPVAPHLAYSTANYAGTMPMPSQGVLTAQAVTAALSNPYAQTSYHSSHYAQAYSGNGSPWPATNAGGYTLSSTYASGASGPSSAGPSQFIRNGDNTLNHSGHHRSSQPHNISSHGSWYQFGNSRCTYKNCTFTGSQKALETHMMDRHLIYPPGWDKKKQKDWDADPSLKGKPIPIQGTTINLDDPEILDAWIAERKKRWPSTIRVEDKKRKLDEARARGQISVDDPALLRGKRRKTDGSSKDFQHRNSGSGRGRAQGRGRGRGRGTDGGWRGRGRGGSIVQPPGDTEGSQPICVVPSAPKVPSSAAAKDTDAGSDSDSDSDSDAPPDVITSKAPPSVVELDVGEEVLDPAFEIKPPMRNKADPPDIPEVTRVSSNPVKPTNKPRPAQPKKVPYNPFASRPTLLRNLLLPEIRVTVSNLSQAIRFLVDNDFLRGVELKPGEADEKLIEVIADSTASTVPESEGAKEEDTQTSAQ